MKHYFDQTATVVAMVVAIFRTDHLFSPLGTTVKQFGAARFQAVQKPLALIFQVPTLFVPACSRGSRLIFPSGVKVILNLAPEGLMAVNGSPLKKVARISAGDIGSAAIATALPNINLINIASSSMRPGPLSPKATVGCF
jgi:hypothetical protein